MKDIVTIDGVTLSRKQVEKAYQEMNAPPPLKHLDRVRRRFFTSEWGVVLIGPAQQAYMRGMDLQTKYRVTIIAESGAGESYLSSEMAFDTWEVIPA